MIPSDIANDEEKCATDTNADDSTDTACAELPEADIISSTEA